MVHERIACKSSCRLKEVSPKNNAFRSGIQQNLHSDQIASLFKMVKELEEKSVDTDNSITKVKSTTESNTLNISLNHKQMEKSNSDRKF